MNRIRLANLASLAEIVGTIAVVISLLFVAISIDRNTKILSGQEINEIYDAIREIDLIVFADPELMRIVETDAMAVADLSEADRLRYRQYVVLMLEVWDRAINRENEGLIDKQALTGWHEYYSDFVRRYLTDEMWHEVRWNWQSPELVQRIEDALES